MKVANYHREDTMMGEARLWRGTETPNDAGRKGLYIIRRFSPRQISAWILPCGCVRGFQLVGYGGRLTCEGGGLSRYDAKAMVGPCY